MEKPVFSTKISYLPPPRNGRELIIRKSTVNVDAGLDIDDCRAFPVAGLRPDARTGFFDAVFSCAAAEGHSTIAFGGHGDKVAGPVVRVNDVW